MKYHMTAFFIGFILDLAFGDPHSLPHPVRLIGKLIAGLEKCLRSGQTKNDEKSELARGMVLAVTVVLVTVCVTALLLAGARRLHPYVGIALEAAMTYQILAARSLKTESMKVYGCLKERRLEDARKAVSRIVGRDTETLEAEDIAKAAVETVAENTSDGVIAPMLYTALGGPVAGFFYKAVNTMDSMVGYRNERYLYFGRAAARLDDILNYLPARISAYLMLFAAFVGGESFDGKRAYRIYRRDNRNHASPNSGQTEAVCAGALGIQLGGDASYFGRIVKKPHIGDALRRMEYEDIKRANRLLYLTAWVGELLCLAVMAGITCASL